MAATQNYIRSANPFGLADPPKWWLTELAKFDADLVVFASMRDPHYRLARRCRLSKGTQPADSPAVQNHPDTIFMCNRKLVPVTTIIPGDRWGNHIFVKLAERDTWRMGGHAKVSRMLEEGDAWVRNATQKRIDDDLVVKGQEAYASYQYRTGQRVSLAHKGAAKNKLAKPQTFDLAPRPTAGRAPLIVTG